MTRNLIVQKAVEADWKQLAATAHYNVRELANVCQISVRQIEREFSRSFSRPPQDWLNEQRLNTARELLLAGNSVKQVALDLGFKQVSHFCRQFKLHYKLTPREFVHSAIEKLPPFVSEEGSRNVNVADR